MPRNSVQQELPLHEVGHIRDSLLALGILNGVVHYETKEDGWLVALDHEKITRVRKHSYTMPSLHLDGMQTCDRCGAGLSLACFQVLEANQEGLVLVCPGCEQASSTRSVEVPVKQVSACADDCLWAVLEEAATKNIQEFVGFPETPEVTKFTGRESLQGLGCTTEAGTVVHRWVFDVVKASLTDNESVLGLPGHIQKAVQTLKNKDVTLANLKKIRDVNGRYLTLSMDQVPKKLSLGCNIA